MPDKSGPGQCFNVGGTRPLQYFRARPSWFGFVVVEQLWESTDGTKRWKKIQWPVPISINPAAAP